MLTKRPLSFLLSSTRAASLFEYATLVGALGALSVAAVLTLGGAATTAPTATEVALALALHDPDALNPDGAQAAPAPDQAGGGVLDLTSIAQPRPVLFAWSQGEFRPFPGGAASYAPHTSAPAGVSATLDVSGLTANVSGLGPYATHPAGGEPFGSASGFRMLGYGGADLTFSEPLESVAFRVHDLDGEMPRAAVVVNGHTVQPAFAGYSDLLTIHGWTEDGDLVVPTSGAPWVVDQGNGNFRGYANRNCNTYESNCSALFQFGEPVARVVVMFAGGVVDVSDVAGIVWK